MSSLGDFMTRDPYTLGAGATLFDAMTFMREKNVRHIPILDDDAKLLGIVTDRDVKRATPAALLTKREEWMKLVNETTLEKVMTREPITGDESTPIKDVFLTFVEEKIGCMPVVTADGKLVGICTSQDLFRAALKLMP